MLAYTTFWRLITQSLRKSDAKCLATVHHQNQYFCHRRWWMWAAFARDLQVSVRYELVVTTGFYR